MNQSKVDFLYPCRTGHLFDKDWLQQWYHQPTYIFSRGEQISYSHQLEKELFLVICGNVSVGHLHEDGKECVLGIVGPRDFIDLPSVFSENESEVYATALTEVEIVKVPKQAIIDKVMETPELSYQLLAYFSNQLQEVIGILEQVAYNKVEERLLHACYRLVDPSAEKDGFYPLPPYITHKDIAGMIASTRETVTFIINKLKQNNEMKSENNRLWIQKESM